MDIYLVEWYHQPYPTQKVVSQLDGKPTLRASCDQADFAIAIWGSQVNAQNIDGATPLCDASNSGDVECVRLLLRHGARVNLSLNVTSALHEALLRSESATTPHTHVTSDTLRQKLSPI